MAIKCICIWYQREYKRTYGRLRCIAASASRLLWITLLYIYIYIILHATLLCYIYSDAYAYFYVCVCKYKMISWSDSVDCMRIQTCGLICMHAVHTAIVCVIACLLRMEVRPKRVNIGNIMVWRQTESGSTTKLCLNYLSVEGMYKMNTGVISIFNLFASWKIRSIEVVISWFQTNLLVSLGH